MWGKKLQRKVRWKAEKWELRLRMQRWVIISALQGRRLTLCRSRVAALTRLRGTSEFFLSFPSRFSFVFSHTSPIKQPPPISLIENSLSVAPRFYKSTFSLWCLDTLTTGSNLFLFALSQNWPCLRSDRHSEINSQNPPQKKEKYKFENWIVALSKQSSFSFYTVKVSWTIS